MTATTSASGGMVQDMQSRLTPAGVPFYGSEGVTHPMGPSDVSSKPDVATSSSSTYASRRNLWIGLILIAIAIIIGIIIFILIRQRKIRATLACQNAVATTAAQRAQASKSSTTLAVAGPSSAPPTSPVPPQHKPPKSVVATSPQQTNPMLHDRISAQEFVPGRLYNMTYQGYQHACATQQPFVVLYHADWCGPCRATYPHFAQAASQNTHLPFVAIEANYLQGELKKQLGIEGFPTIRIVRGGQILRDCSHIRTVNEFVKLRA